MTHFKIKATILLIIDKSAVYWQVWKYRNKSQFIQTVFQRNHNETRQWAGYFKYWKTQFGLLFESCQRQVMIQWSSVVWNWIYWYFCPCYPTDIHIFSDLFVIHNPCTWEILFIYKAVCVLWPNWVKCVAVISAKQGRKKKETRDSRQAKYI